MKIYLVGGAVRDELLDIPVKDRDWVVVGSTAEVMLEQGFTRVDADFPVFLHPETGEEYALARRETKCGPGYKGFDIHAGPDVTLEQDLERRDLTINAMVMDDAGTIVDPFHGRDDLDEGLLRHVAPAFVEDPVRLLRIARFAAKLGRWGFRVAHGTHGLMKKMALSDDLKALKPERLWQEMKRALAEDQPWQFFQVLHRCGALSQLIPELMEAMGDPSGHGKNRQIPAIDALGRAAGATADPRIRFAVLFYHATTAPEGEAVIQRLRVEREFSDLLAMLLTLNNRYRMLPEVGAEAIFELLIKGRALQQPERFWRFITACSAIWPDEADQLKVKLETALHAAASVSAADLQAEGLQGQAFGSLLAQRRLEAVRAAVT